MFDSQEILQVIEVLVSADSPLVSDQLPYSDMVDRDLYLRGLLRLFRPVAAISMMIAIPRIM